MSAILQALHCRRLCQKILAQRLREARQERCREWMPERLPPEITSAMEQARRPSQLVRPLPVSVNHVHARQRGSTDSVIRTHLATWLNSEEGVAWQQERALLYEADQASDSVPSY